MIDNLRREHFKLGEQNSGMYRSSASYGQGVQSASKKEVVPWASMKTNYALGIDKNCTTTDYQSRFAQTTGNFREIQTEERLKNKAKMTSDSVVIAENKHFSSAVSSKMHFRDTSHASRQLNTGLDKMTTSYITGSHFKPGYGGFSGQAENKRAFNAPQA